MVVLLAVGTTITLVVSAAPQFYVTLGTREVLLVPLTAEGIHHLG